MDEHMSGEMLIIGYREVLFVEDQGDVAEKYFNVFKNIFARTNHLEHYEMMMKDEVTEVK